MVVVAKHKSAPVVAPAPASESAAELIARLGKVPVAGADLADLIELTHSFIVLDLQQQVAIRKASRDGASLPIGVLEAELVRNRCSCFAALKWLGR